MHTIFLIRLYNTHTHTVPIVNRLFLLTQESDEHDTSHLIQLCAYVQCYQDTVTILLGDSELSEDIAGLEGLVSTIVWEVHVFLKQSTILSYQLQR